MRDNDTLLYKDEDHQMNENDDKHHGSNNDYCCGVSNKTSSNEEQLTSVSQQEELPEERPGCEENICFSPNRPCLEKLSFKEVSMFE